MMKVLFCSNYMNHHQYFFSKAMRDFEGIDYKFIASERMSEERKNLGYSEFNEQADWIVNLGNDLKNEKDIVRMIQEADLVIAGSFPMKLLRRRILSNKITFLYSERWFKTADGDVAPYLNLHGFLSNLLHRKYFNFFNVYMLCAGAYTAHDCSVYGNFKDKCFKWGYFPETIKYDITQLLAIKERNNPIEVLWAGRMIAWKHPEVVITLGEKLKDAGIRYHINMIGNGPMLNEMQIEISRRNLQKEITLLGGMTPAEVRIYMEKANIFIMTSDYNEGWGVVLNEAMNSGCAVVCNEGVGSALFLIENGKNGFIYQNGDIDSLINSVKQLINDSALRRVCGVAGYNTIINEWNPVNAARKVMQLYHALSTRNRGLIPKQGVASPAPIITYGITSK